MKPIFLSAETDILGAVAESSENIDLSKLWNNSYKNIIFALLILIIGIIAVKFAARRIKKLLEKSGATVGSARIVDILIKLALYFAVLLMAASALGIPTASVLALFSVFALSFSLAIKDTLSLVASGLIIVVSKPFVIGDLINIPSEDIEGRVKEIGLIHTHLYTATFKEIIIPNNVITASTIINYTRRKYRRIDSIFPINYSQDVGKAKAAVLKAVLGDESFIKEPVPFVGIAALNQSSVDLVCKVYVEWDKYDDMICRLNEIVFEEFKKEGIEVPYNQLDVHLK